MFVMGDPVGDRDVRGAATLGRALALLVLLAVMAGLMAAAPAGAKVTREGILQETVRENLAQGKSVTTYSLRSASKTIRVVPTTAVSADAGDRVAVTGRMRKGRLVGSIADNGASASIGPITNPIFSGPRKVLVLLVKFAGDSSLPWSVEAAREKIFTGATSANVFFQDESRGVISLGGKTNPEEGDLVEVTLNSSGAGCAQNTWATEALARAAESGVGLSGYNHFVFAYPRRFGCFWSGMATVGGNSGSLHLNGNVDVQTIAHEFGHNFGFYHAGSMSCTQGGVRVQISDSCSVNPYGDVFDAMGNVATRHNNGWNLAKIGMLKPASVVTVDQDGTYNLRAALSLDPAPTILRIPKTTNQAGAATSWYYLEVRQQSGIFENVNDESMKGVSIRIAPISFGGSGFETETVLLDANPATSTFVDAPLRAGDTFYDGKVRIKTLTAGGGSASVAIELNSPDTKAPTVPANLLASQVSSSVKLQWASSLDDVGVLRYSVIRDGSQIGTSTSTSFTDPNTSLGPHTYAVQAEDAAGNRSAASGQASVTVVDKLAPSIPTNLSASQSASGVTLQWAASSDNVGVGRYVIFRDGIEIGASPTATFSDGGPLTGQHTYAVQAEDAAGNRSSHSAGVSVIIPGSADPGAPSPTPGPTGGDGPSRSRPVLQWARRPHGAIAFDLDARQAPEVIRVSLWVGRHPLRSKAGSALRFVWKPRALRCGVVYRFIARAHTSAGEESASVVRLRASELRSGRVACRTRKAHRAIKPLLAF